MGLSILMLVIGLVLLVKGGDWLVSGASSVARKYGISELVIGLTVVAFGTSAPELVVSVLAAVNQHPEIALGNVIGSNNFNLFVILGITGIIAPLSVQVSTIRKEIPISLGAAVLLLLLANEFFMKGQVLNIGRWDALVFLVCFALFLFYVFKSMKRSDVEVDAEGVAMKTGMAVLAIVGGLAALILGGRWVVNSAVDLARMFHVSEKVIGLTIVAMGTSLPELVTSLVAIRKKSADMAIGNVIGSNIFNIFLILGTSAMIRPMVYSTAFNHDLLLLLAGTVLLLVAMFTGGKRRLDRWEAFILLAVYMAYLVYVALRN
ncbi:MAG: calcium/sodium antiporter [Bacteroidales bacterium]|nr:calcium/sodium antiporter [Bacteroidales bacterium]